MITEEKKCPVCSGPLKGKQRTCSPRCRKRLSRGQGPKPKNTDITVHAIGHRSAKNPNLIALHKAFTTGKRGMLLEGSSRSGKSWACVDFLVWLCSSHDRLTIAIVRETFNSFKTTLYQDLAKRLPMFGIADPIAGRQNVSVFQLFTSTIHLIGADDPAKFHGLSTDVFWINEILDVSQPVFDQLEMRCRRFWIADFNPKATAHWVFDRLENRDDVVLFRSTYKDNPHISPAERAKIESYEPTETNIAQGTADQYMWNVYGLGLRSAPEGLIFQHFEWVDEFPTDIDRVYYGADVGQTSPSAVAKVGVNGQNIYLECLGYVPTPSTIDFVDLVSTCVAKCDVVWCDSAAPGFIAACQQRGYSVHPVRKFPGSRKFAIGLIKSYKLHVVRNQHHYAVHRELTSFKYRMVNGISLDEPIDGNDHFLDSSFYGILMNLK